MHIFCKQNKNMDQVSYITIIKNEYNLPMYIKGQKVKWIMKWYNEFQNIDNLPKAHTMATQLYGCQ